MKKQKAVDYLTQNAWSASRLGLERIEKLLEYMGNPHHHLPFIHIAGTNGKGSMAAMLSYILVEAGYRTGLYTSPALSSYLERIQINNSPVSEEDFTLVTQDVKKWADQMEDHPTEFEMATAVGIGCFARQNCDIVIMEVGMGGRLDATNIIPVPEVALITSISFDHMAELGDNLSEIAFQKAGIIKKGAIVILHPQEPIVEQVIEKICNEREAKLIKTNFGQLNIEKITLDGSCFSFAHWPKLHIPLLGLYQPENTATVLTAVMALQEKGWHIDDQAVLVGLERAKWPARFELLSHVPYFLLDGGHNPQGVVMLLKSLQHYFPQQKVVFIMGVLADKNYNQMIDLVLPCAEHIFTVTPDSPRALGAESLATVIYDKGFTAVTPCKNIISGVDKALKYGGKEKVLCAFGSLSIAGTIRKHMLG